MGDCFGQAHRPPPGRSAKPPRPALWRLERPRTGLGMLSEPLQGLSFVVQDPHGLSVSGREGHPLGFWWGLWAADPCSPAGFSPCLWPISQGRPYSRLPCSGCGLGQGRVIPPTWAGAGRSRASPRGPVTMGPGFTTLSVQRDLPSGAVASLCSVCSSAESRLLVATAGFGRLRPSGCKWRPHHTEAVTQDPWKHPIKSHRECPCLGAPTMNRCGGLGEGGGAVLWARSMCEHVCACNLCE